MFSLSPEGSSASRCETLVEIAACVRLTPLERPVVPPVYCRIASEAGSGSDGSDGPALAQRVSGEAAATVTIHPMPSSAASPRTISCSAASQTIAVGSASARIARSSCAVYIGLSGTSCAPAARIAKLATAASIEFAISSATRPPRAAPSSAAKPATLETYSR